MPILTLDQTLVDSLYALAESLDQPELRVAAQLVDLAWQRTQAVQDLRHRWCTLTRRQQEVALLMYAGHTNVQIAQAIQLSKESVRSHARLVFAKIGVANRKEPRALLLATDVLDEYLENYKTTARAQSQAQIP